MRGGSGRVEEEKEGEVDIIQIYMYSYMKLPKNIFKDSVVRLRDGSEVNSACCSWKGLMSGGPQPEDPTLSSVSDIT